jgi:phosphatidylglycerophosphate synthase
VSVVFFAPRGTEHLQRVGGLTVIERRIREVAKDGAARVVVAADPVELPRPLPIPVEFVPAGSPPPTGARPERVDVVAGIELVDADARARAEWALIRRLNKSFEGPIDALINWRFSMRITRLLARRSLAVTPNHVTMVSILVGLAGAAFATWGTYAGFAIGGVLLELNSILDSVDGELARLRYQFSKLGQWLDNVSDDVVDNVFVVAVGHALGGLWWWLALGAAGGRVVVSAITYVDVYRRTGTGDVYAFRWFFETAKATSNEVYDRTSLLTYVRSLGRRDTFVFVWMVACVAGVPEWVVGHAAAVSAVYVVLMGLQLSWFRKRTVRTA